MQREDVAHVFEQQDRLGATTDLPRLGWWEIEAELPLTTDAERKQLQAELVSMADADVLNADIKAQVWCPASWSGVAAMLKAV